jgi:hypothetical protein
MNPNRYWRFREEIAPNVTEGDASFEATPAFLQQVRPSDGIILASWDAGQRLGLVRYLGVVRSFSNDLSSAVVSWRKSDVVLKPNPAGRRWWTQEKPFFKFASAVVERYMLDDLFAEAFPEFADMDFGSAPRRTNGAPRPSDSPTGGYVYVIRSEYGFKIGKTVNLRERTRLFSVKLPFPISIEHYAWFDDYTFAESRFHRMFADKRLEGEWFDLTSEDLEVIRGYGDAVAVEGL